jgi:hypothetical protein
MFYYSEYNPQLVSAAGFFIELHAARLERSSFCGAKRNKKAGVEDGKAALI